MARRRRGNVVLAPISRWLLWSPWRLLAALAAALILAGLLSAALRSGNSATRHPVSGLAWSASATATDEGAPAGESSGPASSSDEPTAPVTPTTSASSAAAIHPTPSTAPPPAAALNKTAPTTAAEAWVALWARPNLAAASWQAALRPLTYDDYMRQLVTVDPTQIPATKAGGGPASVVSFAAGAARVRVPVTGGSPKAVTLTLIFYPMTSTGRWLVNGATPG